LKRKIDEMDDFEIKEKSESEWSFKAWVIGTLKVIGLFVAQEVLSVLWRWFKGLLS
jgi:hypothetical protein